MKKFILGAVSALVLFATTANATVTEQMTTGGPSDSTIWEGYSFPSGTLETLLEIDNGNPHSKLIVYPDEFYIGSTKFTDLMDSKASASDMTTVQTTLSGISAQQPSDWNASSGVTRILNKPSIFSGAYTDLTGKPTLFSGAYTDLTGKPSLFSGAYTDLTGKPTIPTNTNQLTNGSGFITSSGAPVQSVNGQTGAVSLSIPSNIPTVYEGTSLRSNPVIIYKSATVSSGTAVMYLTTDNTSTGTALCPNGIITPSINPIVNDATASYQMGWAITNSNKTLTVTTNNFTTANLLTGLLGQSPANGKTVNVSVICY